jgi:hypothetical protein
MAEVFPSVVRDPFDDTNTLMAASVVPAMPERLRAVAGELPHPLRPLAREQVTRLGPRLPGGTVYTDDRAPVEWLVDRSILGYAASEQSPEQVQGRTMRSQRQRSSSPGAFACWPTPREAPFSVPPPRAELRHHIRAFGILATGWRSTTSRSFAVATGHLGRAA